jgi:hypothetical protein
MAAKKPAKKNITTMTVQDKVLPGKMVKYHGSKNAKPFTCPVCIKSLIKGILFEYNSILYCSRTCIPKVES